MVHPGSASAPERMSPSQVLDAAADLIMDQGWSAGGSAGGWTIQTWAGNGPIKTPCCAQHAIQRISRPAFAEAEPYVRRLIGGGAIWRWNDAPERTQAEVVKALRDAAELARSEGQ